MSDEETQGEAGENVIAFSEEERSYQDAKGRYEEAGRDLDRARKKLQDWEAEHDDGNDKLKQDVNDATRNLQITDQALQNAERRWKDARAAAEILVEPARRTARASLSTLNSRIKSLYSFASKLYPTSIVMNSSILKIGRWRRD